MESPAPVPKEEVSESREAAAEPPGAVSLALDGPGPVPAGPSGGAWSVLRWSRRLFTRWCSCGRVPGPEALLRMGLLTGDAALVQEALHPERARGSCRRCARAGRRACLSYGYPDDRWAGLPAVAAEYLCQGARLGKARKAAGSAKRAEDSDGLRAQLLRWLFTDPAHAAELLRQFEDLGRRAAGVGAIAGAASGPGATPSAPSSAPALSPLLRCAASGSGAVLAALAEATGWRPWEAVEGVDAREEGASYQDARDLRQCRRHCLERGYAGFVVLGGWAYFCRRPAQELEACRVPKPGAMLHIAPGIRSTNAQEITRVATAGLLLARDPDGQAALDAALAHGCGRAIQMLSWMGGMANQFFEDNETKVLDRILYGGLPQWLARAVGALPTGGGLLGRSEPSGGGSATAEGVVLEDAQQIRDWMSMDRMAVANATGLSEAAAEALLRHHGHSVEAAIGAYRSDPQGAKAAARLPEEAVGAIAPPGGSEDGNALQCGVCFGELPQAVQAPPLWRQLPCGAKHPFCDDCLRRFVEGRLAEGDVRGLVCPEPSCRLPLGEDVVERIAGPAARGRFVQLAASQAVDGAAHMAWCPQPGCGRAVVRSVGLAVQCSCGHRFCSSCLWAEGHEPASCQDWEAWRREFPDPEQRQRLRRERGKADTQWLQRHTQRCPGCSAVVQRNGGCNHMICRCGMHFCYVCGRRWEEHVNQPGGLHFYRCRLGQNTESQQQSGGTGATSAGDGSAPVDQFDASLRSVEGARQWAKEAVGLWEALHGVEPGYSPDRDKPEPWEGLRSFIPEAVEELLTARQDMRFAAVFAWGSARAGRETGPLEFWLGELEGACATLEAVLGPRFSAASEPNAAAAAAARGHRGDWPCLAEEGGDLRRAAGRLRALEGRLEDLRHLQQAVRRLRARLLAGARNRQFEGPPPGLLGQLGRRVLNWLGF